MAEDLPDPRLLEAAKALESWLEDTPHALIGGFAVAFRGRARSTRDVDGIVAVPFEDIDGFMASAEAAGFAPREPAEAEFAKRHFVMRLVHLSSKVEVDLSIALSEFEEAAIGRAEEIVADGATFAVLRADDLVVMKAFARRPQDWKDIENVLARNPGIDRRHIRRWLGELARLSEEPSILTDFEALLQRIDRDRRVRDALASGDDHA